MYWEAGAARFLIQDLITRRASNNIRVRGECIVVTDHYIAQPTAARRARPSKNISVKLRLINWSKALLLDFSPIAPNCWPTGAIADYKLEPVGYTDLSCMGMHGQHVYTCREPARRVSGGR